MQRLGTDKRSRRVLEKVDIVPAPAAERVEISRRFVGSEFEARLRRWVKERKISKRLIRELLAYMHEQIDQKVQSNEYDGPSMVEAQVDRWAINKQISDDHSFIGEFLEFIHIQIDENVKRAELSIEWKQKGLFTSSQSPDHYLPRPRWWR